MKKKTVRKRQINIAEANIITDQQTLQSSTCSENKRPRKCAISTKELHGGDAPNGFVKVDVPVITQNSSGGKSSEILPVTEKDKATSDLTMIPVIDHESDGEAEADWNDVYDEIDDKPKRETVDSAGSSLLTVSTIGNNDVTAVLMHMEGRSASQPQPGTSGEESPLMLQKDQGITSDEESDWEEVADYPVAYSTAKSQVPTEPVEITVEAPNLFKKRKKGQFDWMAYFQRQLSKFQRNLQLDMHKVHMLCLLAYGMQKSHQCSEPLLLCQGLSLVPQHLVPKRKNSTNSTSLNKLVQWVSETFVIDTNLEKQHSNTVETLGKKIASRHVVSALELAMVFTIIFRSLGLDVRLLMSCQPIPIKCTTKAAHPRKRKHCIDVEASSKSGKNMKNILDTNSTNAVPKSNSNPNPAQSSTKKRKKNKMEQEKVPATPTSVYFANSESGTKNTQCEKTENPRKSRLDRFRRVILKTKNNVESSKEDSDDSSNPSLKSDVGEKNKKLKREQRSTAKQTNAKNKNFFESNHVDSDTGSESSCPVIRKTKRKSIAKKQTVNISSESDETKATNVYISSGSDFEIELAKHKTRPSLSSYEREGKRVLSESGESVSITSEKSNRIKTGVDHWVEVFLKSEDKWICINCVKGIFGKPEEISASATQPLQYILAYHKDGNIKDLTAKYAPHWLTKTRKVQASPEWWQETLDPYKGITVKREKKEDADVKAELMDRPFPTSIGDFKGHPLYILTRHLLKFEAIYPDTAIPLGYIRKEPIYAKELVHTLHSRDNWFKEALSVKLGEQPYKMVKSRPKKGQKKENPDILDLQLFGRWQTEDYVSPPAIDGKVPKNEFGAVALFQPSMLPAGTVLMTENGLNRVARKLGIDSAPAHTGWDFHGSFSHPVYEGVVVCEEFEEILRDAWIKEQEIQRKREVEKREKRVYSNWKLLIKSLLIKEKLKKRFNLEEPSKVESEEMEGEKVQDYPKSWPLSKKTGLGMPKKKK